MPLRYRNLQGELVALPSVAASEFKNQFGAVFEKAALGGAVAITKHEAPKAVLMSYAQFEALVRQRAPDLDDLSARFDSLLAGMQQPAVRAAMARAFAAEPARLGEAALKAGRKAKTGKRR